MIRELDQRRMEFTWMRGKREGQSNTTCCLEPLSSVLACISKKAVEESLDLKRLAN